MYYQFPNGDYTPVFVKKIGDFVQNEIVLYNDSMDCIIIFTHGFALRVIVKHFLGINDEDFRFLQNPPNCYLAKIHVRGNAFVLDKPLPVVSL